MSSGGSSRIEDRFVRAGVPDLIYTTSGTFSIPIFNNTTYTGDRTFTLTATGAASVVGTTNNVSISPTNGTATIGIEEDEWYWE